MLRSSDLWISNQIEFEKKIDHAQQRIIRAIFFKKKSDSLQEILQRSKILTVYEIFIVESVKELFRQLRQNGEWKKNCSDMSAQNAYSTRQKGLFATSYSRTAIQRKSFINFWKKTSKKNLKLKLK